MNQPTKTASIIRPITLFSTLILIGMFIGEGLAELGIIPFSLCTPPILIKAYCSSLICYVAIKEGYDRWYRRLAWRGRRGGLLVVLWWGVLVLFAAFEYFNPGEFNSPSGLLEVFLFVQGTFAATRFSKHIYLTKRWKEAVKDIEEKENDSDRHKPKACAIFSS